MLPVVGPAMTERFAYRTRTVPCGSRSLVFPSEFALDRPLALMVQQMAERTDAFPYRRENLAILREYLGAAADAAREVDDPHAAAIDDLRRRGVDTLVRLEQRLRRDIQNTADVLLGHCAAPDDIPGWPMGDRRLSFVRFGGFIDGLVLYRDLLTKEG
jgi:hypothetical protein